MSRKRVGVDIGATAVRVAQVDGVDKDSLARVTKAAIVPLTPGAVVAGRIRDTAAVGYAIERALKKAKVNGYGIIVGVSSPESAIAPAVLPLAVKPNEWAETLRLQGKAVSPRVDLSDSALSLYSVGENPDTMSRTLLAAATSQEEVDAVAAAVRAAKATPRAIDLAGAATMRALARALPGNEDVVTVVDIGASKVTIVTRQGLYLRSVRTIETGGEDITRAIMGATEDTYDFAEHRKRSMRLGQGGQTVKAAAAPRTAPAYGTVAETRLSDVKNIADPAEEALRVAAFHMVEEIAAVIDSDTHEFPNAPTQGLVLTGGGSLLQGLKEAIADRVGVATLLGRPWSSLTSGKGTSGVLATMDEPTAMIALATAVGLAMWSDQ